MIRLYQGSPQTVYTTELRKPENVLSCHVIEKKNDTFELTMRCGISEANVSGLREGNMIRCYANPLHTDTFTFEIYDVKYNIDHTITVKAEHISARLKHVYFKPFNAPGTRQLKAILEDTSETSYKINGVQPFKFEFDSEMMGYETNEIKSLSDIICGSAGSILSKYHGRCVIHYNDTTIKMSKTSPFTSTKPYPVRYGVNMKEFEREIDLDAAVCGQVLYWHKENEETGEDLWTIAYIAKNTGLCFNPRNEVVDLTEKFETQPTEAQLKEAAPSVSATKPSVTTSVSVAGYEGNSVLYQKIPVYFPEFGVEEELEIVETDYDVIRDIYSEIKLGTLKKTLSKTIASMVGVTKVGVY